MRKFLLSLVVLTTLFAGNAEARRIRIPVDNSIPKVATLPDSSYYQNSSGVHLDLGYIEEDGKRILVMFSETKPDTYYEISEEYAEAIRQDLNVEDLSTLIPKPSLWDRWGGSIIFYGFAGVAALGLLLYLKDFIFSILGLGKKDKDE